MRRFLAFATFLVLSWGHPTAAHAAETPQQIAEAHLKNGLRLFSAGDFESARLAFLQAQSVYPRPSLLRNLALCELKTNRPLDALGHLRAYLDDPSTSSEKKEQAKKNLDDAYAKTAHAAVKTSEGASFAFDGQAPADAKPLPTTTVDTTPGLHRFESRLGARVVAREVDMPAGAPMDVDLTLAADSAPNPIESNPRPLGQGYETTWGKGQYIGLGLALAGTAGLATGAVFAFAKGASGRALDTIDAFNQANGVSCAQSPEAVPCVQRGERRSDKDRNAALSVGFVVGGGVAMAAGAAVFFLVPRAQKSALRVVPWVGPRVGGLSIASPF